MVAGIIDSARSRALALINESLLRCICNFIAFVFAVTIESTLACATSAELSVLQLIKVLVQRSAANAKQVRNEVFINMDCKAKHSKILPIKKAVQQIIAERLLVVEYSKPTSSVLVLLLVPAYSSDRSIVLPTDR